MDKLLSLPMRGIFALKEKAKTGIMYIDFAIELSLGGTLDEPPSKSFSLFGTQSVTKKKLKKEQKEIERRRLETEIRESPHKVLLHTIADGTTIGIKRLNRALKESDKESPELIARKFEDRGATDALQLAVRCGNKKAVKILLSKGADPNARDIKDNTVLHWIIFSIEHNEGFSKSLFASLELLLHERNSLLSSRFLKVDINAQNTFGDTFLHGLMQQIDFLALEQLDDIIRWLSKEHRGVNIDIVNNEGNTPLHILALQPDIYDDRLLNIRYKVATFLLGKHADPHKKNQAGVTPFELSLISDSRQLVNQMVPGIDAQNALTPPTSKDLKTPESETRSFVYQMLFDIIPKEEIVLRKRIAAEPEHTLHALIKSQHESFEEILSKMQIQEKEPPPYSITQVDKNKLPVSNISIFKLDINGKNNEGNTPLHEAVACLNTKAISILVKKGVNTNSKDTNGNAALHLLPGKVYDVTTDERKHKDSILEVFKKILEADGTDINITNKKGETPLHVIVQYGCHVISDDCKFTIMRRMIDALLAKGAKLDIVNRAGITPIRSVVLMETPSKTRDEMREIRENGQWEQYITKSQQGKFLNVGQQKTLLEILLKADSELTQSNNLDVLLQDIQSLRSKKINGAWGRLMDMSSVIECEKSRRESAKKVKTHFLK